MALRVAVPFGGVHDAENNREVIQGTQTTAGESQGRTGLADLPSRKSWSPDVETYQSQKEKQRHDNAQRVRDGVELWRSMVSVKVAPSCEQRPS